MSIYLIKHIEFILQRGCEKFYKARAVADTGRACFPSDLVYGAGRSVRGFRTAPLIYSAHGDPLRGGFRCMLAGSVVKRSQKMDAHAAD